MLDYLSYLLLCILFHTIINAQVDNTISSKENIKKKLEISCALYTPNPKYSEISISNMREVGCLTSNCARIVDDFLFTTEEIDQLKAIADLGMSKRISTGGPTILDINTGYIRDTNGLENLFSDSAKSSIFSEMQFSQYGSIIKKLKTSVESYFDIKELHFTAPTFITRLDGREEWSPSEIHDEYWHPHVDRNNTEHYHYSGLLYLSTYEVDFTGGQLIFIDQLTNEKELTIQPKAGRVVIFTSGPENTHYVERVTSGNRFVLAFWFTCDNNKQFEIFLDGKRHMEFSHKVRNALDAKTKHKPPSQDKEF